MPMLRSWNWQGAPCLKLSWLPGSQTTATSLAGAKPLQQKLPSRSRRNWQHCTASADFWTAPVGPSFLIARDPLETGGDCSDWRLHCEHGAEPSFAVRNTLVSLRSFGQWIGLN